MKSAKPSKHPSDANQNQVQLIHIAFISMMLSVFALSSQASSLFRGQHDSKYAAPSQAKYLQSYINCGKISPFCISPTVSLHSVENVVNAPKKPVVTPSRISESNVHISNAIVNIKANAKAPKTLKKRVKRNVFMIFIYLYSLYQIS